MTANSSDKWHPRQISNREGWSKEEEEEERKAHKFKRWQMHSNFKTHRPIKWDFGASHHGHGNDGWEVSIANTRMATFYPSKTQLVCKEKYNSTLGSPFVWISQSGGDGIHFNDVFIGRFMYGVPPFQSQPHNSQTKNHVDGTRGWWPYSVIWVFPYNPQCFLIYISFIFIVTCPSTVYIT